MGVVMALMLFVRAVVSTPPGINERGLVELVTRPRGAALAQAGSAIVDTWSYPDYLDVRSAATGLTVTGWTTGEALLRLDNQPALPTPSMYVSSNYFANLGVSLLRGPGFTAADDAAMAPAEAVIGARAWRVRFGRDPDIVGRSIVINGTSHVIVGVAPDRFRGHIAGLNDSTFGLWLPLSRHPQLAGDDGARRQRDQALVRIVARLAPGTTVEQVDQVMQSVVAAVEARNPAAPRERTGGAEPYFASGARRRSVVIRAELAILGMCGVVLLVVGLNVSGMLVVRGAMRERELAIRLAMGASRWRLVRHHLSEALVMATLGGTAASALLFGTPVVVARWMNLYGPELDLFRPDAWIVFQSVALCFVTSLVLGLLPAVRFSRPGMFAALRNAVGGGPRVSRVQRLTAALQAGLAVPFLVTGLVRVDRARVTTTADTGFNPRGLYVAELNTPAPGATDEERQRAVRAVQDELAQSPGIASVSVGDGVPLDFRYRNTRVARAGDSQFVQAHTTRIGPGYLDTVGIRLLAGRTLGVADTEAGEPVVLLSEPLARQLFPSGQPLGERVSFALGSDERRTYTVVGITADVVSTQMGNPRPQLFVSLAQHPSPTMLIVARGTPSDLAAPRALERALKAAEPALALRQLLTGEQLIDRSYEDILTEGAASGVAATVALALAALGIYGVIAFMVATRTRDIGVRMALGASRRRVLTEVLSHALTLVVPGIGVGLVAAAFLERLVDPTWYDLGIVEPLIYTLAAGLAFGVAALAGTPSACRAARIQPMEAMRSQ